MSESTWVKLKKVKAARGKTEKITIGLHKSPSIVPFGLRNLVLLPGANMGIVLALPLSGVIASDWGWEYAFYLFGSLTLVWLAFWAALIKNSPGEHPKISEVKL